MTDLSKLPWGELRLDGLRVEVTFGIVELHLGRTKFATRAGGHWVLSCSMDLCIAERVIAATKLVDAFILEHSKPKLPDVVPPDGCEWKFGHLRRSDDSRCASLPGDQEMRNMYLACCEAAEPMRTGRMALSSEGHVVWENHRMIPVGLEPGRYAVSFRRLP